MSPIKNQILYSSIHSIKYTVLQYTCAKNRIKTVCKIYCNTVYLIRYNSILYTVVQNTVYLQYTFIIYIRKYSILTVSQFFIGMVSRRYAKANNPGMGEGKWNAEKLKTFLLYLDANNLYGWAMMQYLPTGGFRWVRDEYSLNKLKNLVNNGLIKDDADEG